MRNAKTMLLILDADNIDIQRNMSTIEQEPLTEKFLTGKDIAHLADDITTGNKENIEKQENIINGEKILDVGGGNVIDTDKEVPSNRTDTVTNNLNVEKANEDDVDTEDVQTSEEVNHDESTLNHHPEQQCETPVLETLSNEKNSSEQNEDKLEELSLDATRIELTEDDVSDLITLDKNSNADVTETVNGSDIVEKVNEEDVGESDKEVDSSELSKELNEEKEMDLDKEEDIVEVSSELNKENDIEIDETVDSVENKELEKESVQNEVPITNINDNDRTPEDDCSKVETFLNNKISEKNDAIEIDDEDESISETSTQSAQTVQENVDKKSEPVLINDAEKSSQVDATVKNTSEEPKRICRLSNNLDIFSDEEDDQPSEESSKDNIQPDTEKQCINIDDDDDIMLIDEDSSIKENKEKETNDEVPEKNSVSDNTQSVSKDAKQPKNEVNISVDSKPVTETIKEPIQTEDKDVISPVNETSATPVVETNKMDIDKVEEFEIPKKPLLPNNFINTCKKKISDMTRNDLEEFCILKIVESIVDRSNLGEIKAHLKNLTQTMEECKNKCLMLTKQNKDLQVVLKSVQEEQKSGSEVHITPLKITRSVGMQVMMVAEKTNIRRKPVNGVPPQVPVPNNNINQVKNQQTQNTKNQKEKVPVNQQIPVPRLVPAAPTVVKPNPMVPNIAPAKQLTNSPQPNGMRNSPPVQKIAEKRGRTQAVTVDLTDDEPPPKLQNVQRSPMNQQMRVLTAAPNLVPAQRFPQNMSSPRKVYIPISGPQSQNVRPGQTIMLKTLSGLGPRPRPQAQALIAKAPQTPSPVRFGRGQPNRHPAPLPDAMKQYQSPNWKSLPPAPDLKLSKVENGIVISWKIDGYQEENHEEIASYQLYAYQETTSPPNTALWKKIGDVKALPLPMACTLTQFMAGYKYYFAVRAVDIRSRFGPFSLPGSILLLNKM